MSTHQPTLNACVAGQGTKVHYRYGNAPQTLCGQGLGSRGGRTSQLRTVVADATCQRCITKVTT